jgi:adhesin/invasin
MMQRAAAFLLSILSVVSVISIVAVVGCDKATPVAPGGSILAISANPTQISLNGSSTITVIGRKPDGQPLNPGTEIRLSATNGSIPSIVVTDRSGSATATFHANSTPGTATITAATGTGSGSGGTTTSDGTGSTSGTLTASVTIQVGIATGSKPTVLLSVSPNNIPVNSTATVTAIVRNADGSPAAAGTSVILTTTLGTLKPKIPSTGADGVATSTLTAGSQPGSATISAIAGSSDAATTMLTIRDSAADMSIQANPSSIGNSATTVSLSAFVSNSQGQPLQGAAVTFQSDRGKLDNTQAFTDTTGKASVTLTLTASDVSGPGICAINVMASTPSGSGVLITRTTMIKVTGNQNCS